MTKQEANEKGLYVESYATGFMIADYSGNRGEGSYCGKSMNWRRQPIVDKNDVFSTEEEALLGCDKA